MQFSLIFVRQRQWFSTGGTRTLWGYQTPKQGVRCTNIFRHTALKILMMCCRLLWVQ